MSAIFTPEQQEKHRTAFIEECRQKAWGARCHADWVAKGLDKVLAEYEKLKKEDTELDNEITSEALARDAHTRDNRDKRKELQAKRNGIAKTIKALALNMQQGQKAMQELYQSAESNLSLAAHAEEWKWPELSEEKRIQDTPSK